MRFVGIDPGATGAVAHVEDGAAFVADIPTFTIEGKKRRTVLDGRAMFLQLQVLAAKPDSRDEDVIFLLEAPVFGPAAKKRAQGQEQGNEGAGESIVTIGNSFRMNGQIEGILISLAAIYEIRYEVINPQVWKRAMMPGEARDKNAARLKAIQLFPSVADDLKLVKHHNRAEALLLAEWGRRRG